MTARRPENYYQIAFMILMLVMLFFTGMGALVNQELILSDQDDSTTIKVMTYNVHQYYETEKIGRMNLELIRDDIKEENPDIVGLQESEGNRISSSNFDGVRWLANQLDMHSYYGPETSAQIYGVSILSKWEIESADWIKLPNEESIERVAIDVQIDSPFGILNVIVTHLQTDSYREDQLDQAQEVVNIAEKYEHAIILGDFNTEPDPDNPIFEQLNTTFTDVWFNCEPNNEGLTVDPGNLVKRIDYIWVYEKNVDAFDIVAGSCSTGGDPRHSDHLYVVAELMKNII